MFVRCILMVLGLAVGLAAHAGSAQEWPTKPVTLVVPYPAGGPNDALARIVAQRLGDKTGQPFIVENKVGAAGNIGANAVARARPDGYTLLATSTGPQANNKFLYADLPYDPVRDFAAIVLIAKSPVLIAARKNAPFASMAQMVAYAKANPGKLNIGTAGHGSVAHITSEFMQGAAGIKLTQVPFPGSTPLLQSLLAGQIDLVSDLAPSHVPMLKDHRYQGLAIASAQRLASLPDVPTFAQAGLPAFDASAWTALMAPAGTPAAVVSRLNRLVNEWISSPEGARHLATFEMAAQGGSPADLDAFIAAEIAKWGPIIAAAGITAQ